MMNAKGWVLKNVIWILIALIVANLVIVYWGTVNLGIYGGRNWIFGGDLLRRKKLLQEQGQVAESTDLHPGKRFEPCFKSELDSDVLRR